MRPVQRGDRPLERNGQPKQFAEYQKARRDLIDRLGEYCSYCEMKLDASLAVEHVQPKKPEWASANIRERELNWDNFLLACTNCNSTKSNAEVVLTEYYWPDRDNTFRAFTYSEGGLIAPSNVAGVDQTKAQQTINLTGLDKHPLHDPEASDRRWLNRREVWDIAVRSKERLARNNTADFREQIVETATGHAYWSVWMTVFADDADLRRRFITVFPGTAPNCFDAAGQPVPRPGGQI